MIVTIENANEKLLKAIKSVVELYPKAKVEVKKKPSKKLLEAIKQVENGEVESFKNFEEFKKAMK